MTKNQDTNEHVNALNDMMQGSHFVPFTCVYALWNFCFYGTSLAIPLIRP